MYGHWKCSDSLVLSSYAALAEGDSVAVYSHGTSYRANDLPQIMLKTVTQAFLLLFLFLTQPCYFWTLIIYMSTRTKLLSCQGVEYQVIIWSLKIKPIVGLMAGLNNLVMTTYKAYNAGGRRLTNLLPESIMLKKKGFIVTLSVALLQPIIDNLQWLHR